MLVAAFLSFLVLLAGSTGSKPTPGEVTVQATNKTQVPSVTYIVDAVECLKEAYSIYDNDEARAELYAALFQEKHNASWNVVVGYTAIYTQAEIFVETTVTTGGKDKVKDDSAAVLFLIFSAEETPL